MNALNRYLEILNRWLRRTLSLVLVGFISVAFQSPPLLEITHPQSTTSTTSYAYLPIIFGSPPEWESYPSPTSTNLNAVATVSDSEAWAVGDAGLILHYQNGVWTQVASSVTQNLNDIAMLNEDEGWIVGDLYVEGEYETESSSQSNQVQYFLFLHYIDSQWVKELLPCELGYPDFCYLYGIDFSENIGYAVGSPYLGADGYNKLGALKYENGQWRKLNPPCSGLICFTNRAVSIGNSSEVWIADSDFAGRCGLIHGQNDVFSRLSWEACPINFGGAGPGIPWGGVPYTALDMLDQDHGWALNGFGIMRYQNDLWNYDMQFMSRHLYDPGGMDFLSLNDGWVVGNGWIAHWDGLNWTDVSTTKYLIDVDLTSTGEGWAVGLEGAILHHRND